MFGITSPSTKQLYCGELTGLFHRQQFWNDSFSTDIVIYSVIAKLLKMSSNVPRDQHKSYISIPDNRKIEFYKDIVDKEAKPHLHFIVDVDYFTKLENGDEKNELGKFIYVKYFSERGSHTLDIPQSKRKQIIQICEECLKEELPVPTNIFDETRQFYSKDFSEETYNFHIKSFFHLILYNHWAYKRPCELPNEVRAGENHLSVLTD